MSKFDWNLFETIFSDAHIIDVDFSEWDRLIRLVVESDHAEWINNRLPIFSIQFISVRLFACSYNHIQVILENPDEYCQWKIHDYRKKMNKHGQIEISLISPGPGADILIKCKEINMQQIEHEVLDSLFGHWNKPYSPLARRSIKELYASFFPKKVVPR
jgi:hypothetical protein